MIASKSPQPSNKPAKKIPKQLIYEIIDGQPFYRKGYKEVLAGQKNIVDIMGSSSLQAFIISFILKTLYKQLDDQLYLIFTNEAGLHLDKGNNLAGDILIYEDQSLSIENINENYFSLPPKIVIEVDISAEVPSLEVEGYVHNKTKKLLNFGVEKVIWITTVSKKVLIATKESDWTIKDWDKAIEILPDVTFSIGQYLKDKGSKFA